MTDIQLIQPETVEGTIFIGCIGYESRSVYYLTERMFGRNPDTDIEIILYDYCSGDIFSYLKNQKTAQDLKAKIIDDFHVFWSMVRDAIEKQSRPQLIIDLSSFDRENIGLILKGLFEEKNKLGSIKFVYCPRKFKKFDLKFDIVRSFGPALPIFMGDVTPNKSGLTLILGTGYEYGKAVGAIDTLEPDRVFCFRPTGTAPEFDNYIDKANVDFSFMKNDGDVKNYNLLDCTSLYFDLRQMAEYENLSSSVLILPLGPKIFAAISMLIALIHHPCIKVWRHSTETKDRLNSITDAEPSGEIIEFAFIFN